ncbi:succinate dehydrogenase assembly factor 2 [Aurantiacibacter sp. MUD11]|uniref:FAD assembly factor SdhE n=1 Tax=Aurantiacibacter sp. MUD11 TaxID=3003265 RepID=UPI0022AAB1A4|nr:succinate dehydrogenase assembly factor 2 [Aurantiacibacter sp. MUD11]WAT18534.1 succinate dehydrogenase assembly factor 2 [Aurantiacibacter sp. MUD11]
MAEDQTTDLSQRFARAKFRAWHRGTREADYMFGCYFDTYHADWDEAALAWFEALLDFDDVDVMAWAMERDKPPQHMQGAQMDALRKLDYVRI